MGRRPLGASRKLYLYRGAVCQEMSAAQIGEKTADFAGAARLAREAGFDAVELHAGHGYLLSQFLSSWINRRRDRYGGSLENRLRFRAEVVRRVRVAVGPDFPVLVKLFPGGLELEEAVAIARGFEQAGASVLIPSCGFAARTPPVHAAWPRRGPGNGRQSAPSADAPGRAPVRRSLWCPGTAMSRCSCLRAPAASGRRWAFR